MNPENTLSLRPNRLKILVRDFISRIPGLRFWVARWIFLGPGHNTHRFWGVFASYAEAKAHIPRQFKRWFDAPNLSQNFDETISDRDREMVRILSGLMPEIKTVFDLGGNIGLSFYQYRSAITYPSDFRWTVCDVPFVNEAGRRIARQRGETRLAFTDHRQDADNTDVYLTCGALQYFDCSLADLLSELKTKPRHVMINRVPLTETGSFFTLQHMGYSVVPYHIANRASFIASMEGIGYELAETWKNDRFCEIILRPERYVRHYHGFYFRKIEASRSTPGMK